MGFRRSIGIWTSLLFLGLSGASIAQNKAIIAVEGEVPKSLEKYHLKSVRTDAKAGWEKPIHHALLANGYLTYQWVGWPVDSAQVVDTIRLIPGPVYTYSDWELSDELATYLPNNFVRRLRMKHHQAFEPEELFEAMDDAVTHLENHGYPFARLQLDSVSLDPGSVSARLQLEPGPLVAFDTLDIRNFREIPKGFLAHELGILPGKPYDERAVKRVVANLNGHPFLTLQQGPTVRFVENKALVSLVLLSKPASRFDGIIGFLPSETPGEFVITGDVSVHLVNPLKLAETLDLRWRRLQANTQDLKAQLTLPYLFNTPISPVGAFKIYRRDTAFTDLSGKLGLRFSLGPQWYVSAFGEQQVTRLISVTAYQRPEARPPFLDRSLTAFGFGMGYERLDYRLNPAKGLKMEVTAAVGNKRILPNQQLPEIIYDGLEMSSIQWRAEADVGYYVSPLKRLVWHQQMLGGLLFNEQLLNNEATRLGGLKTMRGFNEELLFATNFLIGRNELRYQTERDGYVFLFGDVMWYENESLNRIGPRRDTPYAVGAGVTFATKAGIFNFSGALGSQQGNPLLLRTAKIHFGFLNVF